MLTSKLYDPEIGKNSSENTERSLRQIAKRVKHELKGASESALILQANDHEGVRKSITSACVSRVPKALRYIYACTFYAYKIFSSSR